MSDEDALRQLFREARPEVDDAGFTRHVVQRVDQMRQRRRLVLGTAAAAGAFVAVPALLPAIHALTTSDVWTHVVDAAAINPAINPEINIVALCACAVSLWLVSVCVEA